MKAKVNEKDCVGCGLCADNCPTVFEMAGGVAKVIADPVPAAVEKDCRDAAESCPVSAISVDA